MGSMISRKRRMAVHVRRLAGTGTFISSTHWMSRLNLTGATKSQIEQAMQGHILANAELIGTFQKGDR